MNVLSFFVGLTLLIVGAELLIRGATRLAGALGISPLVIGLTVVAFGTSSPELAVSVDAAWSGQGSIAIGNVVGSNIFNVLFILGLSALVVPLAVSQQLVRLDVPLMIGLSVVVWLMARDAELTRLDGILLVAALIAYTAFIIRQSRREQAAVMEQYAAEFGHTGASSGHWPVNAAIAVAGLILLVTGSRMLVQSATVFAAWIGVSEVVIGLTIVAAGTSLPEVVTSVVAAIRGERDIAVGNVVGSNLFNLMGVLGIATVAAPDGLAVPPSVIAFDLPVMAAVAIACLPIFLTGVIGRIEGGLLLAYYVAYTLFLILAAVSHDRIDEFGEVLLYFVVPITAITLFAVVMRMGRPR